MKSVKYVGFFSDAESSREVSLAAVTKMQYIIETLNTIGYNVDIISPAISKLKSKKVQHKKQVGANTIIYTSRFAYSKYKLVRGIRRILNNFSLLLYLIKNIKKDEKVVIYHSLYFMRLVNFVRKIKSFELILEVEEIYTDVIIASKQKKVKEMKFINTADKYIFSTELLNEKINVKNKPYIVNYGSYKNQKQYSNKFDDGKVHLVYAGTLQKSKGAETTVKTAEFLNANYVIHILGFGNDAEREHINKTIDATNAKNGAKVIYEGVKKGEEYLSFIQKCHIGLSTQEPDSKYNDTSFPSKILSYLSNGLMVVTVKIPAIEKSKINKAVTFYEGNNPKQVAEAIISLKDRDLSVQKNVLIELDKKFLDSLTELLAT